MAMDIFSRRCLVWTKEGTFVGLTCLFVRTDRAIADHQIGHLHSRAYNTVKENTITLGGWTVTSQFVGWSSTWSAVCMHTLPL